MGLKKQISKVNPKMGYFGGPNMPLSQKSGFKANLVSFWRPNREEKREEEKEEEERKRKEEDSSQDQASQGMDAWILIWNFGFVWISCLDISLWVMGCRKPNPRRNLCMEIPLFL